MDIRLVDTTTGNVIEEFDNLPNHVLTRLVTVNPGVGTFQFKLQARCDSAASVGGALYGAAMVASQAKR